MTEYIFVVSPEVSWTAQTYLHLQQFHLDEVEAGKYAELNPQNIYFLAYLTTEEQ